VLARAGFEALFLSGAGVAASAVGLPDLGLTSFSELLGVATNTIRRTDLPVIVDADTGFGNELNVTRTVRELGMAGAAAVTIEDQAFPKRCGHVGAKDVVEVAEFVSKVRAARRACDEYEMLLIARTDAIGVVGLEDAIARSIAAHEAGADILFLEAPRTVDEVERIAAAVNAPKLYNLATGGVSPAVPIDRLGALGYDLILEPGAALMPAIHAMKSAADDMRRDQSTAVLERLGLRPRDIFAEVGLDAWLELEAQTLAEAQGIRE
jgi:2-methylisocitrate lyase-like PEP mutase family enzyme